MQRDREEMQRREQGEQVSPHATWTLWYTVPMVRPHGSLRAVRWCGQGHPAHPEPQQPHQEQQPQEEEEEESIFALAGTWWQNGCMCTSVEPPSGLASMQLVAGLATGSEANC